MSTVILTNWTIYYADDATAGNGMKQIKWTGGPTGTNTLNELYSEVMHVFDAATNNNADDSVPLKAVTPTLYEIGSFDAGDKEPWFIDPTSVEHLTGGGLNTVGWTRTGGGTGDIGIVKITRTGTNIVDGDVGATIANTTFTDTGWLLHVDDTELWIRPTSNATNDDWDSASGTITCNGNSDTQAGAAADGENIWANIYSIGAIVDDTEIYITQSDVPLTQWWSTGHIDILVLVSKQDILIDNGLLRVFARQYSTLYDVFETTVSTGGRNPIPLATADDINNDTGYRNMTFSGAVDTYTVGEKITGGTSTADGIVTAVSGSPTTDLDYYLVGDLTVFQTAEVINGADSGSNESSVALSDVGPNTGTPATITATFGGTQEDLGNGFGNAWYSVSVNCQGALIADVYERLKYVTRRGHTTDIDAGGQTIDGEEYQGVGELYIPYDAASVDPPFVAGDTITVTVGSTFSSTLTAIHDRGVDEGFVVVRDYSGTVPVDGNTLSNGSNTALVDDNVGADPVVTISPNKQSPFGSFAGGKFFGARGVWIYGMHADDANNYSLTDSENNTQDPPASVSVSISGLVSGDRAAVFRANADGTINKTYMSSDASANSSIGATWTVDSGTPIPVDTPSAGTIRLRDMTLGTEEKIAYTSFTGDVFSLSASHAGGYGSGDFAYAPYIDEQSTGSSVSKSITYTSDRTVLARVRISGIVPFNITGTLDDTGYSTTAIRTTDGIV